MAKKVKPVSPEVRDRRLSAAISVIKTVCLALLLGFVLTLASLLVPVRVESAFAVDDMRFGKPFAYMIQSFSGTPNEEFFPCNVIPKFTERYSTEIDIWTFCASFAVNSVIAAAFILGFRYLKNRKKAKASEASPQVQVRDGFAVTEDKKDLV